MPPIVAQSVRDLIYPIAVAYRDDSEFIIRAQTGSWFKNRTSDFYGYTFSVHGYKDWRLWAIALALCSTGDTIVEIGANIGTETVGFSDIVGISGKVFAFEPLPSNIDALKQTLCLARYQNVTIFPFAVGDECKRVTFALPPTTCSGVGHIVGKGENPESTINVECVTVDSLSDRLGRISMISIDAEGADLMVLRGAKACIMKDKPNIVIEANPRFLENSGFNVSDLYHEIKELGYNIFEISRLGLSQVSLGSFDGYRNWLCTQTRDAKKRVERYIRRCGLFPCVPGLNPLTRRRS